MQIYVNDDIHNQITMIITYKWIYFPVDPHKSAARPVNYSHHNERSSKKNTKNVTHSNGTINFNGNWILSLNIKYAKISLNNCGDFHFRLTTVLIQYNINARIPRLT